MGWVSTLILGKLPHHPPTPWVVGDARPTTPDHSSILVNATFAHHAEGVHGRLALRVSGGDLDWLDLPRLQSPFCIVLEFCVTFDTPDNWPVDYPARHRFPDDQLSASCAEFLHIFLLKPTPKVSRPGVGGR